MRRGVADGLRSGRGNRLAGGRSSRDPAGVYRDSTSPPELSVMLRWKKGRGTGKDAEPGFLGKRLSRERRDMNAELTGRCLAAALIPVSASLPAAILTGMEDAGILSNKGVRQPQVAMPGPLATLFYQVNTAELAGRDPMMEFHDEDRPARRAGPMSPARLEPGAPPRRGDHGARARAARMPAHQQGGGDDNAALIECGTATGGYPWSSGSSVRLK